MVSHNKAKVLVIFFAAPQDNKATTTKTYSRPCPCQKVLLFTTNFVVGFDSSLQLLNTGTSGRETSGPLKVTGIQRWGIV